MGNRFVGATLASAPHPQYLLGADDLGDAWPAVDVGTVRDDGDPD